MRVFVRRDRCLGCRTCELECAVWRDSLARRLMGAATERPLPRPRLRVLAAPDGSPFPNHCRQCADAPCVLACPSGALARREGSAPAIVFRHELCLGCYSCVLACPFVAARPDATGRFPLVCDACAGMDYAACVDACPVRALTRCEPADFDPADGYDPFGPHGPRPAGTTEGSDGSGD
ncbi:MAG: 4Fe-4S binding protein [Bacillota bacterium]|nr:4Fe-4S binding protein [Bacillota bacterium]